MTALSRGLFRKHVCVLQPATPRQTGTDVHCGFSSQRCVFKERIAVNSFLFLFLSLSLCFCFYLEHMVIWIFSLSLCRLQQDIQSISGRRPVAAESHSAPSALHPHRSLHTQTQHNTHIRILIHSTKCVNLTVNMQKVRHTNTNEGVFEYLVCRQQANVCPDSEAVLFLYVGYYILVYLQGFFLHCVNTRQQEMLCHSLFLPGKAGFFWTNRV